MNTLKFSWISNISMVEVASEHDYMSCFM